MDVLFFFLQGIFLKWACRQNWTRMRIYVPSVGDGRGCTIWNQTKDVLVVVDF
jgi:hypothetical protein